MNLDHLSTVEEYKTKAMQLGRIQPTMTRINPLDMLYTPQEAKLLIYYINKSIKEIESGAMGYIEKDIDNLNRIKEKIDWFTDVDKS